MATCSLGSTAIGYVLLCWAIFVHRTFNGDSFFTDNDFLYDKPFTKFKH